MPTAASPSKRRIGSRPVSRSSARSAGGRSCRNGGTIAEEDEARKKTRPKVESSAPQLASRMDDDDEDAESIKKGYGVVKESEAEVKEAAKNKPKFTEVQDKFKKMAADRPRDCWSCRATFCSPVGLS